VAACPEGAIAIEIVNIAAWRRDHERANAPGLPSADDSISTTRVTLPENLAPDLGRVAASRVEPEHPHWPLVFMLVTTQLCVGAFTALWLLGVRRAGDDLRIAALVSMALAGAALGASTMHLGRPIHAWKAMRGLRRSWLSREVLALTVFAGLGGAFAGMLFFGLPGRNAAGFATAVAGLAGVGCSARIYVLRAGPAWRSGYTPAEFFSTALLLGPAFLHAIVPEAAPAALTMASLAGCVAQLAVQAGKYLWLSQSEVFELRSSSALLAGRLRALFAARMGILVAAGIAIPMTTAWPWLSRGAFAAALAGELLGRYLFFVSVVPKNMAAAFAAKSRRAA
jgi:DMSO reductase anchor subunit